MLSRRLGGGSRDRRLMAETIRDFRCRLGSREPETAPAGYDTYLGADRKTGACNISRSPGRAGALVPRRRAIDRELRAASLLSRDCRRSRAIPARASTVGIGNRPACPDLPLSACAGRLPEWNDPRSRQPPEDWKLAQRLLVLPPIASSGSAETSSRPGLQNEIAVARSRRQDRPPSGPPQAWP